MKEFNIDVLGLISSNFSKYRCSNYLQTHMFFNFLIYSLLFCLFMISLIDINILFDDDYMFWFGIYVLITLVIIIVDYIFIDFSRQLFNLILFCVFFVNYVYLFDIVIFSDINAECMQKNETFEQIVKDSANGTGGHRETHINIDSGIPSHRATAAHTAVDIVELQVSNNQPEHADSAMAGNTMQNTYGQQLHDQINKDYEEHKEDGIFSKKN